MVDLNQICTSLWLWPDPRSRSRSLSFWSSENCTFLGLSFPPFWHWAQNWWLIILVWDLVYSLSQPDFLISFSVSYHVISNFAECQHYRTFIGLYFRIAWCYSHMVGYAGSPIRIVHADMTLTRSKVKVRSWGNDCRPVLGPFYRLDALPTLSQQCPSTVQGFDTVGFTKSVNSAY